MGGCWFGMFCRGLGTPNQKLQAPLWLELVPVAQGGVGRNQTQWGQTRAEASLVSCRASSMPRRNSCDLQTEMEMSWCQYIEFQLGKRTAISTYNLTYSAHTVLLFVFRAHKLPSSPNVYTFSQGLLVTRQPSRRFVASLFRAPGGSAFWRLEAPALNHTVDDRNPASPHKCTYIHICTILPEFLWSWYIRAVQGHAGFL